MSKKFIEIGQVSIFDIPKVDTCMSEIKALEKDIKIDIVNKILTLYKNTAKKIIRLWGDRYSVALEDETIYFNKEGKEEYRSKAIRNLIPLDQIIFSKNDEEVNQIQKNKLEEVKQQGNVDKIIKRFGDSSYIVITKDKKTIAINSKGWIIPYLNQAKYSEEDILIDSEKEEVSEEIEVGSTVRVNYKGIEHIGKVLRMYGPGNVTMNIIFDGMHTAFYKGNVKLA